MTAGPDIAIVMLTYNHAWSLPETLDSLLAQTFQDFHLLIVDDASRDDSYAVAQSYQSRFKNCVVIRNDPNKGSIGNSYASIGLLDEQCPNARFCMWACPDDIWSPTYLEVLRATLLNNSDAVVAQSYIDEDGPTPDAPRVLQRLLPLEARSYAAARKIFSPVILPGSIGNYNATIHGLIRHSEWRKIFSAAEAVYTRSVLAELSLIFAMLLRGSIAIAPEQLFHKRHETNREERYPDDKLTEYYRTVWRRAWAAAGCLPWFLKIRRADRPLSMVIFTWLHLIYFYAHLGLYRQAKRIEQRMRK